MKLRWYTLVIDCRDIHAQARWWAQVLDGEIVYEDDDEVAMIPGGLPEGYDVEAPIPAERWHREPPALVFVPVAEGKQVKNRLHIDLAAHVDDDRDAQIRACSTWVPPRWTWGRTLSRSPGRCSPTPRGTSSACCPHGIVSSRGVAGS